MILMSATKNAYPNLRAEMARLDITIQDIADLIGTSRDTVGAKLSRKRMFYLDEAFEIADTFFSDKDVHFLFQTQKD